MLNLVTIRYGMDTHNVSVDSSTTINQIVGNPSTKAILGYGDNVKALVLGVEQSGETAIGTATELVIETRANQKAV